MLLFALESFLLIPGGSESKPEFLVTTVQSPGWIIWSPGDSPVSTELMSSSHSSAQNEVAALSFAYCSMV